MELPIVYTIGIVRIVELDGAAVVFLCLAQNLALTML
jgi:hypothetical protein